MSTPADQPTNTDPTPQNPDGVEPFEQRRWRSKTVRAFAAMDTIPQIGERVLAIVGENRVMNKIATYVHTEGLTDLSRLDHATGLHKGGHAGHPEGHHLFQDDDQSGFTVYLTHGHGNLGTMEGFGVGVRTYNAATEKQVRARHDNTKGSTDHLDRRRDITYVELHGRPGDPHRDDRIEIMDWNEHGVLRHTIITFVEPDYCDSGRTTETNYAILGHRKNTNDQSDNWHCNTQRDEEAELFASYTSNIPLEDVRKELRRISAGTNIDFAWIVEETVTRERRSIL